MCILKHMRYFDAHLHIVPDAVLMQAYEKGVDTFICNAAKQSEWQTVLDIPKRVLGVWTCLGVHPWYINEATPDWRMRLEALLVDNPLAMIGEIGLDKKRPFFEEQKRFFKEQLKLAQKLKRSVHIHCVGAWPEMVQIMSQYPDVKALFHRFNGDEFVVQKLRFLNSFFSVMEKRYIPVIPDYRLLVESDAPDGPVGGPDKIPDLVKSLELTPDYLNQNLRLFLDDKQV